MVKPTAIPPRMYIHSYKDRHGRLRRYLRRPGFSRIRLPDVDGPAFEIAYAKALASTEKAEPQSRVVPGSFEALAQSYQRCADFRRLDDSTRAVYARIIGGLCKRFGALPVRTLHQEAIHKFMREKAATPAAANHLLRTFRALMRHAVETGLASSDPTQGVRREKERGEGAETWTEADIAAFEARWPIGSKPRLALALLLYTGQRRSDVVRLGPANVTGDVLRLRQVKTGAALALPIRPELAVLLPTGGPATFLRTEADKPYTPNGFYMRFRGWCEDAGLPAGRSPHGLRKAAARRLAEAGCSAHEIAAITGHKTLAEVQRYTRAVDQEALARQAFARGAVANPPG